MKTSAAFNLHKRALRNSHRGLCVQGRLHTELMMWKTVEYWLFHGTGDERKRHHNTSTESVLFVCFH